jgi:hypothetical protein
MRLIVAEWLLSMPLVSSWSKSDGETQPTRSSSIRWVHIFTMANSNHRRAQNFIHSILLAGTVKPPCCFLARTELNYHGQERSDDRLFHVAWGRYTVALEVCLIWIRGQTHRPLGHRGSFPVLFDQKVSHNQRFAWDIGT